MSASKIMVIRHAEKPDDSVGTQGVDERGRPDPRELAVRGWQRAGALVRFYAPRDGHFADPRLAMPSVIFAASPRGRSLRSLHTVHGLARALGLPVRDEFGTADQVPDLVASALACDEVVLISWRHESIATIGRTLLLQHAAIPDWDEDRFDLVWVFAAARDGWTFEQVPQLLLPGDSPDPIAIDRVSS